MVNQQFSSTQWELRHLDAAPGVLGVRGRMFQHLRQASVVTLEVECGFATATSVGYGFLSQIPT